MTEPNSSREANIYKNVVTGATPNPVMHDPDAIDQAFAEAANQILNNAVETIRVLIGAHQSAAALVVQKDWQSIRKYFSLSEKYAAWAAYRTPASGFGIHAWFLNHNQPVRLTQAELEAHPEWRHFGTEESKHPPMRGWLATPLVDTQGTNWGLLQLSDKYEGEFTEADERHFTRYAELVSIALETSWKVRDLRKALA